MPRLAARGAARKAKSRKTTKSPLKKSGVTSTEINNDLLNVLKGGLSGASLDDSTNEWQQFKPSNKLSKHAQGKDSESVASNDGRRVSPRVSAKSGKRTASPLKRSPKKPRKLESEDSEQEGSRKDTDGEYRLVEGLVESEGKVPVGKKTNRGRGKKQAKTTSIESKQNGKTRNVGGVGSLNSGTLTRPSPTKKDRRLAGERSEISVTARNIDGGAQEGPAECHPGKESLNDGDNGTGAELPCPCCGCTKAEIFPDGGGDMNDHALMCLHQKFNRNVDGGETSTGKPCDSNRPMNEEGEESIICQICDKDISHMTAGRREQHVNRCIDISSSQNPAETTDDDDDAAIFCQICTKNLTHLNSRRRMQHVNRCIDSNPEVTSPPVVERQKATGNNEETINAEASRVPKCIICGTGLNTHQKKRNHLKSCALKNNITTIQLLDMIKRQEAQNPNSVQGHEGAVNGVDGVTSTAAVSTAATKARQQRGRKPRRQKKKEDLDENVQVAMAISASVAEQEDAERQALGLPPLIPPSEEKAPEQPEKGRKTKRRGRKRKENAMKFAPLLTRTSPENRKIWAQKLASCVERPAQAQTRVQKTPETRGSRLATRYSKEAAPDDDDDQALMNGASEPIWSLTHCDMVNGTRPFYVDSLKPYVSPAKTKKTRKKSLRFDVSAEVTQDNEEPASKTLSHNMSHGLMTQEAINDLIGLANEDSQEEYPEEPREPLTCGFIPRHEEKQVPDPLASAVSKSQETLLNSLRDMVDSPDLQPLKIVTQDDQHVFVHHFMLNLRCPKLLKDHGIISSDGSKEIKLRDFSKPELLAILQYLYAGDTDFTDASLTQIEKFAQRFHLEELKTICQEKSKSTAEEELTIGSSGDTSYQKLIQSIWEDEEKSSSSQREDTSSDSQEEMPSLFDMADIYQFAQSQRSVTPGRHDQPEGQKTVAASSPDGTISMSDVGSGNDSEGNLFEKLNISNVEVAGSPVREARNQDIEVRHQLSPDEKGTERFQANEDPATDAHDNHLESSRTKDTNRESSPKTSHEELHIDSESQTAFSGRQEELDVGNQINDVTNTPRNGGNDGDDECSEGFILSSDDNEFPLEMDGVEEQSVEHNSASVEVRGQEDSVSPQNERMPERNKNASTECDNPEKLPKGKDGLLPYHSQISQREENAKMSKDNQSPLVGQKIKRGRGRPRKVTNVDMVSGVVTLLPSRSSPPPETRSLVKDQTVENEDEDLMEVSADAGNLEQHSPVQSPVVFQKIKRGRGRPRKVTDVNLVREVVTPSPGRLSPPPPETLSLVKEQTVENGDEDLMDVSTDAGNLEQYSPVITSQEKGRPQKGSDSEKKGRKSYSLRNWIIGGSPLSPQVHQRNAGRSNESSHDWLGTEETEVVPTEEREGNDKERGNDESCLEEPSRKIFTPTGERDDEKIHCEEASQETASLTVEIHARLAGDENAVSENNQKEDREFTSSLLRKRRQKRDPKRIAKLSSNKKQDSLQNAVKNMEQFDNGIPYHLLVERRWSLRVTSQDAGKGSTSAPEQSDHGGNETSPVPNKKVGRPKKSTPSPSSAKKLRASNKIGRPPERPQFTKLATKKRGFKFKRKLLRDAGDKGNGDLMDVDSCNKKKISETEFSEKTKTDNDEESNMIAEGGKSSENDDQDGCDPQRKDDLEAVPGDNAEVTDKTSNRSSVDLFDNDEGDELPEVFSSKPGSDINNGKEPLSSSTLQSLVDGDLGGFHASTPNDINKSTERLLSLKVNLGRKLSAIHLSSVNVTNLNDLMDDATGMIDASQGNVMGLGRNGYSLNGDVGSEHSGPPSPVLALPSPGTSPTACVEPFSPLSSPPSLKKRGTQLKSNVIEIENAETGEVEDIQEIESDEPLEDIVSTVLQRIGSPTQRSTSVRSPRSTSPARQASDTIIKDNEAPTWILTPTNDLLKERLQDVPSNGEISNIPGVPSVGIIDKNGIHAGNDNVVVGVATRVQGDGSTPLTRGEMEGSFLEAEQERRNTSRGQQTDNPNDSTTEAENTELFAFDLEDGGLEDAVCFEVEDTGGHELGSADLQRDAVVSSTSQEGAVQLSGQNDDRGPSRDPIMDPETGVGSSSVPVQGEAVILGEIDLTDNEEAIDLTEEDDGEETNGATLEPNFNEGTGVQECDESFQPPGEEAAILGEEMTVAAEEVIPGCSNSFLEDLASAPSDEQFWSEQELGVQSEGGVNENPLTTVETFKTPSSAQIISARSITYEEFHSPAPITPMPPYDDMETPELAAELNKFGVKKLRRKPARLKLKELYQYTHQVLSDEETSENAETRGEESPTKKHKKSKKKSKDSPKKKKSPKKRKKEKSPRKEKSPKRHKSPKKKSKSDKEALITAENNEGDKLASSPTFAEPAPKKTSKKRGREKNLDDAQASGTASFSGETVEGSGATDMSHSSQSSEMSDERDEFGESILYEEDDDDIPASQATVNPEDSIWNYILSNPKFFEARLQYQPFDLDKFHKELKAHHIKISKPGLMNILDSMCLTFRNSSKGRRSPKKSPKKKKKTATS